MTTGQPPATRPAAVAGKFYPGDPDTLSALIESTLDSVEVPGDDTLATGYVVPHAGYRFSGPVAAQVYARLRRHATDVERVVLVGPSHYVRLDGAAVPTVDTWQTPFGEVRLDTDLRGALLAGRHVTADDAPHEREHSLEVQLPFLIRAVGDRPVLPVGVGVSSPEHIAEVIEAATSVPGTVLLCSTDFSHYHDHATARRLDRRTAEAVLDLAPDRIGVRDACGVFALRGTVGWARRRDLLPRLLDLRTSADTYGNPERVVGYPAFAFHTA